MSFGKWSVGKETVGTNGEGRMDVEHKEGRYDHKNSAKKERKYLRVSGSHR